MTLPEFADMATCKRYFNTYADLRLSGVSHETASRAADEQLQYESRGSCSKRRWYSVLSFSLVWR